MLESVNYSITGFNNFEAATSTDTIMKSHHHSDCGLHNTQESLHYYTALQNKLLNHNQSFLCASKVDLFFEETT